MYLLVLNTQITLASPTLNFNHPSREGSEALKFDSWYRLGRVGVPGLRSRALFVRRGRGTLLREAMSPR